MTRDLLFFSLGNITCGIREEDIASVSPVRPLHRLPLSHPVMAGMAVIDDHGVTVFDLGACLGAAPLPPTERSRFLLIKRGEELFGFAVAGAIETAPCTDDQIVALPRTVRTPVVASGMVRGSGIVPIIEVRLLLDRLERGVLSVPVPEGPVLRTATEHGRSGQLRVLSVTGETFCMQSAGTSWADAAEVRIATLPYLRGPVRGIAYLDGTVVSVLASVGPFGSSDAGTNASLLIMTHDGDRYGIVADKDLGNVSGSELLPLPALARTSWSREAAVRDGQIIPVLDAVKLLAPPAKDEDAPAPDAAYAPASDFPARFRQGSIEVIEFSLLGSLHALPKDEVKEIFPPVPFRTVPGLPEIVLGVAERGNKLLPVLDLAAIFGRRTAVGGHARMLRVVNGDFQALVLVEEAGDGRILEREVQRQVPIALPHQVLYGCYLDDRAVRLIMNVHSLAVHFERTEIRDMVASLAPVAPAVEEAAERPALPEERPAAEEQEAAGTASGAPSGPEPKATSFSSGATHYGRSGAAASAAAQRSEHEERQRREAADAAAGEEARRKEEAARREEETRRQLEQERVKEAEAARQREQEAARVKAEEQAAAEVRTAEERKAAEERARAEEKARAEAEERERAAASERAAAEEREKQAREQERVREEQQRQAAETAAREEARKREEEAQRAAAAQKAEELRQREEAERRAAEEQERRRAEERLRPAAAREMHDRAQAAATNEAPGMSAPSQRPVRSRKALSIAAVIAAVLLLLLYWAGGPSKDEPPVREQAQPPKASAPAQAKVKQQVQVKEQEPEAPLVLDVPKAMPAPDVIVYVVVKGDTLWGISKRFTGNPFNYPRVARDNSIATPDLIFPGQRIRLRHELQEPETGKAKSP